MISIKDITPKNIKSFVEGYIRSFMIKFFQNKLEHIHEQVEERKLLVAERSPECLEQGQCKICKCKIPELFYADKPCENNPPCYPTLVNKDEWTNQKNLKSIYDDLKSNN